MRFSKPRPLRGFALFAIVCLTGLGLVGCGGGQPEPAGGEPFVIGRRGNLPGRFSFPRGVDATRKVQWVHGAFAVADKTGRIQLLDPESGESHREWFMPRYDHGTPTGIVFDDSQPGTPTLIIADTHYSRVFRYALDGTQLLQFGEYGDQPGQMIYPTDAAVDPDGEIYLTEYGLRDRIMVYDRDGKFQREWGGFGSEPGQFQRPLALVYSPDGRVLVADSCNHRLQWFTPEGERLALWGEVGKAAGQFNYPYDVAIDNQGRIWVAEYGNNRIQVLDAQGNTIKLIGKAGTAPGAIGSPWGIAWLPDKEPSAPGRIVLADTYNHRLQVYDIEASLQ